MQKETDERAPSAPGKNKPECCFVLPLSPGILHSREKIIEKIAFFFLPLVNSGSPSKGGGFCLRFFFFFLAGKREVFPLFFLGGLPPLVEYDHFFPLFFPEIATPEAIGEISPPFFLERGWGGIFLYSTSVAFPLFFALSP